MIEIISSPKARQTAATIACAVVLALSTPSAQTTVPTTACDAALANADLHPQPGMPLEDGTQAFSYTAQGPFVSGGGGAWLRITVALTFEPGPDATIRISALDEACTGGANSTTVFAYTFSQLASGRNTISYDAQSGEIGFNGSVQNTASIGTPRYLFVDVWDGQLPSTHATHSYLIDLLNPANPSTPN